MRSILHWEPNAFASTNAHRKRDCRPGWKI